MMIDDVDLTYNRRERDFPRFLYRMSTHKTKDQQWIIISKIHVGGHRRREFDTSP